MPAKNTIKSYLENGYYHIYNRGVEKRKIFLDKQDYVVFLSYLKDYLLPKNVEALGKKLSDSAITSQLRDKIIKELSRNNFSTEINLLCFCLMPNHFHFLLKQNGAFSINKFMQSLSTRYTMYFNRRYKRVGSLFQAVYKAVLVSNDEQFLHLSRYIHKQAIVGDQPCSYDDYLGTTNTKWVHPEEILAFFSKSNRELSYENFISEANDLVLLQNVVIEEPDEFEFP